MDSFLKKVWLGSGVTLLSMLIIKAMSFLNSIIAARLLDPSEFGALSIVVNLQNFAVILACFGIPLALAKHISQWLKGDKAMAEAVGSTLLAMLLMSSALTAIGYLLLSRTIATDLYRDRQLIEVIRLSSAFVLVSSVNLGLSSMLQGCQKISTLAKTNAMIAVVAQPIAFASISLLGLNGAILALIVSNSLSATLLYLVGSRVLSLRIKKARRFISKQAHIRPLLSFTVPAFLGSLLVVPAYWLGRTVLALQWDFSSVGIYQIAESLSQLILIIPAAVSIPLLPLISEQHALSPKDVAKSSRELMNLAVFIILPLSLLALPFLKFAIRILYGIEYEDAHVPAILMFAASAFIAVGSVISSVIIGIGRMWDALILNSFWLVMFLLGVFALVPSQSTKGLACAYAFSYGAYLFMLLIYFRQVVEVKILRVSGFVMSYAAIVMLFIIFAEKELFPFRLTFALPFVLLLSVTGYVFVLGSDERKHIASLFRRRR